MVEPREAIRTITFVDNYCAAYQNLFPEVRSFEVFKFLHLGMISEIPRKSLPAIALISRITKRPSFASFFNRITLECRSIEEPKVIINPATITRER